MLGVVVATVHLLQHYHIAALKQHIAYFDMKIDLPKKHSEWRMLTPRANSIFVHGQVRLLGSNRSKRRGCRYAHLTISTQRKQWRAVKPTEHWL
jgi:hypothetical protein